MNDTCIFCTGIAAADATFFYEDPSGLFVGKWDQFPTTPGHALIIPKRHMQHFSDMTPEEMQAITIAVADLKARLKATDLIAMYQALISPNEASVEYIAAARAALERFDNRPPDAFNDGINDGPAAGQTVPHLHWHIMPRWQGDVEDPRGGIRHMFAGKGNYHKT
jgi:diadenosine tetraphosphate (Ap4A) HIT family hydrolase